MNTGILDTDEGVGKIKDFMTPILGGEMVKIYRQAPKDMNYGDWVGLTKEYADNHILGIALITSSGREVPASEVMFAGDDINEWGYYP